MTVGETASTTIDVALSFQESSVRQESSAVLISEAPVKLSFS
jgi:hypothetical protein